MVSLIGAAPAVLQGERENPKYKYRPFVPVLRAGEKLQYRVNWKGLKIGYMNLTTGKKPKGTSPWIVYFSTKSNRLSKMPFMYGFFLSKFESKLDGVDGSTQRFKRYMDEGKKFVEEIVTFDNVKMQLNRNYSNDIFVCKKEHGCKYQPKLKVFIQSVFETTFIIIGITVGKFA